MTRTLLLLFILFSHSLIAQVNLNQGLVAYYPFNGNANDASGNGNNGTPMNGVQLTTDRYGNPNSAYYFDGVDDYITIPNSSNLNPTNGLSIVLSFNPSRNGLQNLLGKISYTGAVGTQYQVAMDFNLYPGALFGVNPISNGCIGTPLNTAYVNTNSPITINQWYCLVATFDNGIMKIYLDGVLIQTANAGFTTLNQCSNASIQIGTWWNGDPLFFQGKIDNIRIYNRALNQDEVNAVGDCSTTSCNNWLSVPNTGSYVTTGDVDVAGTQITVEANFNRTAVANSTGGYGFLVSKHTGPGNINYALWPNGCGISTTTNGNALLYENCPIELNKTYHVAMVYDGSTLKFYRNGFLHNQMPLTGNIITNDLLTTIGQASSVGAPEIYQFLGYINEVRIWNVARTQSEIQAYMHSPLPSPTTQPGLLAYYVFNDLANKQGNAAYNGTLAGAASINATNPDCDFIADSCQASCNTINDFTILQSTCDLLSISFQPTALSFDSIGWDFGDGNSVTNNSSPTHLYNNYGNYTVKMIVNSGACSDTVSKTITISVVQDDQLISTGDTTVCLGSSTRILTKASLDFCWTPTSYLDDPNSSTPATSTPHNITYYYTAKVMGNNLITNGDFSAGNTGFASDYQYSSSGLPSGVYFVGANPGTWNPGMPACVDHTSGNGNMLLVNGAETEGVKIWSETVPVQPNTNYAFSTWIEHITNTNPAKLQFSINGVPLGNIFQANSTSCLWEQFYVLWNSGNTTTATISIINKNILFDGNDFALDDISFSPFYIKRDSVMITVDSPYIKTNNDTTLCAGGKAQLNTAGATSYSWAPATGLSNSNIPNPIASPLSTTKYFVTGTDINGCSSKDSVLITVNPKPVITKSNDTLICKNSSVQLIAGGGIVYNWSPIISLNDPGIANPVASPPLSTKYYVTVTDANNCTNTDSVMVRIRPDPVFTISPPGNLCENNSIQLSASGGDVYAWQPVSSLNRVCCL